MEARHNNATMDNLIEIVIALEQIKARGIGQPLNHEDHKLCTRVINLIKKNNTVIVDNANPGYLKLKKTITELKKLKDTDVEVIAGQKNTLIDQIKATFDEAELAQLEKRRAQKKDFLTIEKLVAELKDVPDIFADNFDPQPHDTENDQEEEDITLEIPSRENIFDSDLDDWQLVGEAEANQLAAEDEMKNSETIRVRTTVPEQEQSVFEGWTKNSSKKGGANPPGPYGGVYKDSHGNLAMFKRDTFKNVARVGKIIGEYVATNIVADILNDIHQIDDPDYVRKYVAQVSLVVAKTPEQQPGKYNDDEIYLKSLFIKNNLGDFWEVAHIESSARQLSDADIEKLMPIDIPERDSEIIKAKAQAKAIRENLTLVIPKGQLREIAKDIVKKQYGEKKPTAVLEATFQRYDNPKIKVPSDVLKNDQQLRKQFCEQVAARILVSDFGLHHGNFLLLQDEKLSDVRRLGTIDLGAAFDEFTPEVKPFSFKKSLLEYYKNHLLEFAPNVIYSKEMAEAFITVGKRQDVFFQATIEKIISSEKIPYSVNGIRAFCKRLGMENKSYEHIDDKSELLNIIKGFMLNRLISRSVSLKETGYGLLIENCFSNQKLNQDLLRLEIEKHPELKEFITHRLQDYSTNIIHGSDLDQVKTFLKDYEEDAKKIALSEAQQATLTIKLNAGLEQIEGLYQDLVTLQLQLNHPLSTDSEKQKSLQTGFDKSLASTLKLIDGLKKETEASIIASNNEDHKTSYKKILALQSTIESLLPDKPAQAIRPKSPAQDAVIQDNIHIQAPLEEANKPAAAVLTLAMLGTNEHRSNKTILTELIDSIEVGPNQFAYLIDGPAGSPRGDVNHPMLGTYKLEETEDSVSKIPLKKSELLQQAKSILSADGFEDAIDEAKLIIKRLMKAGHQPLTLNLSGFSRGADSILRLANELNAVYTRDQLIINIFAIDPVAGPKREMATRAKIIPELVQDYTAILQRDEGRFYMEPLDKSHLVKQTPHLTTQTYHLYHGPHTASNYLHDASVNDARDPNKHHTTRLAYDDLSKFMLDHGVKLKNGKKTLNYVTYGTEETSPSKALEGERFYRYTNMLVQHQRDAEKNPIKQREFINHLSDYHLHGNEYFIDIEHMLTFQHKFPYFFDHFFQQGLEFRNTDNPWIKVVREVKAMQLHPNLIESLSTYFKLAGINNLPLNDISKINQAPAPQGIGLIATQFYANSELLKLWEAVQSATHPVRIGYDTSAKEKNAEALYTATKNVLIGNGSVDEKITLIANAITHEIQSTENKASIYNHKLAGILQYLNKQVPNQAHLGPAAHIQNKLMGYIKKHSKNKNLATHVDIASVFLSALTDAARKNLHHDTELMNQLLNTALRATNRLRQTDNKHIDHHEQEKFYRKLIIDISTNTPPMNKTIEQQHQATIIKNKFIEDTNNLAHLPNDVIATKAVVLGEPAHEINDDFVIIEREVSLNNEDSVAPIEMLEVAPKTPDILEPPPNIKSLDDDADLLSALDDLNNAMKSVNAMMTDVVAAMTQQKDAKNQSKLSQNQAGVFYHPSQPEHTAKQAEDQENKRRQNFGKNPGEK